MGGFLIDKNNHKKGGYMAQKKDIKDDIKSGCLAMCLFAGIILFCVKACDGKIPGYRYVSGAEDGVDWGDVYDKSYNQNEIKNASPKNTIMYPGAVAKKILGITARDFIVRKR